MATTKEHKQSSEQLEELLQRIWPEVRRRHLYPEIPLPRFDDSPSPVAMEIRNKQIILNLDYIRTMTRSLPAETVLEALLDHGVSHLYLLSLGPFHPSTPLCPSQGNPW